MAWKPIVAGVDGSHAAAAAAALAAQLAERAGTTCRLVHAAKDIPAAYLELEVPVHAKELARMQVTESRRRMTESLRGAVPTALLDALDVRLGNAPVVLQTVVREIDAGLVVLGGKHHSALERWLGGSTSLNVVRTIDVPILVTVGRPPPPVRRMLVAVDISPAAPAAIEVAERHAELLGAELDAISVLEPLPEMPPALAFDTREYYALWEEMLARDVWPRLRRAGTRTIVRHGMVTETLLREVTEGGIDLLVLGSHGKGWAQRLMLGSTTERLLNHLPTSVLVVPTPQRTERRADTRERAMARAGGEAVTGRTAAAATV